eukprot:TRINITY_DN63490_c0_g1_i1.p1 TRINITY_DN63490_c0_g1~~TRINITY_DN63490_c0_g1_i1.p1  ORF type:complete len:267 (+),score=59.12 TRINITY_DN63490_c0_g1_i1:63-863(+)
MKCSRALVALALALTGAESANIQTGNGAFLLNIGAVAETGPKQLLRVCNACAKLSSVTVSVFGGEKLGTWKQGDEIPSTAELLDDLRDSKELGTLKRKECKDFAPKLKKGSRLDFSYEGVPMGSYTVGDVSPEAVMTLVVHQPNAKSDKIGFKSHAFKPSEKAQVAVMGAYQLQSKIGEAVLKGPGMKDVSLSRDSVLALNGGSYNVSMPGVKNDLPLYFKGGEVYVVVAGPAPSDLVMYPQDKAAACTYAPAGALLLSLLAFLIH